VIRASKRKRKKNFYPGAMRKDRAENLRKKRFQDQSMQRKEGWEWVLLSVKVKYERRSFFNSFVSGRE